MSGNFCLLIFCYFHYHFDYLLFYFFIIWFSFFHFFSFFFFQGVKRAVEEYEGQELTSVEVMTKVRHIKDNWKPN